MESGQLFISPGFGIQKALFSTNACSLDAQAASLHSCWPLSPVSSHFPLCCLGPSLSALCTSLPSLLPDCLMGAGVSSLETALFWILHPHTRDVRRCEVLNGLGGHSVRAGGHAASLRMAMGCLGLHGGESGLGIPGRKLGFPSAHCLFPPGVLLGASSGMWTW